jgi:hypothetical protein
MTQNRRKVPVHCKSLMVSEQLDYVVIRPCGGLISLPVEADNLLNSLEILNRNSPSTSPLSPPPPRVRTLKSCFNITRRYSRMTRQKTSEMPNLVTSPERPSLNNAGSIERKPNSFFWLFEIKLPSFHSLTYRKKQRSRLSPEVLHFCSLLS